MKNLWIVSPLMCDAALFVGAIFLPTTFNFAAGVIGFFLIVVFLITDFDLTINFFKGFGFGLINSPLCQDAYHSAPTVVGMQHAYDIFQAEKVGQYSLELGLREGEASVIGAASKASPAPLPSPSAIFKRSPPLAHMIDRTNA
jgi:hypothetical protein